MSSRWLERTLRVLAIIAALLAPFYSHARELRVCADPDNLPYSRQDGSGFENRIAELLARELDAELKYEWLPQRRGFVRRTLNAELCDVVIGVPRGFDPVRTTQPYYRSTYVFVYRAGATPPYQNLDDPRLKGVRIGVQLIGDDLAATPPGHALARRGIVNNVVGYTIYGDRPQAERMVEAVARGEIDVALVWGPQAAYYAQRQREPLAWSPAIVPRDMAGVPFSFDIAMGVRKHDAALQRELDAVITRNRRALDAILREYGVPSAPGIEARR